MEMGKEFKECRKCLRKKDDHTAWCRGWKSDYYLLKYLSLKDVEIKDIIIRGTHYMPEKNIMTWQEFNDRFMPGNCIYIDK